VGGNQAKRATDDPVARDELQADVARVLDRLEQGGVAIVPLDVAYAVIGAREPAIKRIFTAKRRSYEKPSGMFGDWSLSREVHDMPEDRHAMVREMIEEEKLPFSVVAPFRADHPIFADVDPFVLRSSSKAGTLDMLLNAGQVHDEIARQSRMHGWPVFGSSANTSLAGSKYEYGDIEDEVRQAADIHLDYGRSKYANDKGRSSTIIDFRDFTVIRVGVCFDRLTAEFKTRFDVDLVITERTAQ
jgi:tRNA A37 threonylcarbamoyladenosine synthetase subunit TsaC/SUA5/YrdC